ncbi:MAG: hypothetical protein DLD55_05455 [candidate division SR1 bacterium]|nr:MAG: hypothetical protein DLD55_05455 [candidate division SR1 bacterium]
MEEKNFYQDVPFGTRNGQPNVIPSALVIAHTERIDYVLNIMQSTLGVAVMAIPRDGRPLVEWTQEERLTFFEEAETGFAQMGIPPEVCYRELLLNQGDQVGQTIPHPHLHLFLGKENFLLNWGREGFLPTISPIPFTGELPLTGQYNLYHRYDDKRKGEWFLIDRGNEPRKGDNPRRDDLFPIIVDGKLLPEWEEKIEGLRHVYSMP